MAGIYIHIPFCKQKCNYCNFFSLATTRFRDEFFEALLKEIELTRDYLGNEPVETIYFGGGTPSLFAADQIRKILEVIRDAGYGIPLTPNPSPQGEGSKSPSGDSGVSSGIRHPATEITIELNPEDVTPEYLAGLASTGINRYSLGVQSFFDEDLNYLSRGHDARQAEEAMKLIFDARCRMPDKSSEIRNTNYEAGKAKSENFSIDLIYGIPTLTNEHWKDNLQRVIDLGIPHLSAYALTVEEKTPLAWQIRKGAGKRTSGQADKRTSGSLIRHPASGIRHPVSDEQAAEQFGILMDMMENAGYIQYEISNFCLPGNESRHNSNYWRGVAYLGLGPSAHSYSGSSRRWNISNLTSYIRHLASGILPFEEELLTPIQRYNEYVMTSLRTIGGTNLQEITRRFGPEFETYFRHQAIRYQASSHLAEQSGIFTLSRKGKFLADGIAADLFMVE